MGIKKTLEANARLTRLKVDATKNVNPTTQGDRPLRNYKDVTDKDVADYAKSTAKALAGNAKDAMANALGVANKFRKSTDAAAKTKNRRLPRD